MNTESIVELFDSLNSEAQDDVFEKLKVRKKQTRNDINNKLYINSFFAICLILLLVAFGYYCLVSPMKDRGTFGDMFGAYTAVFSALSFAGVLITIAMQMKELELTRKELKASAQAQNKAQIALNEQLQSMRLMSKFEIMNHYLNQVDVQNSEGEKFVAKEILKNVAESFFSLKENENLIRPNFGYTVINSGYVLEENKDHNRIDFVNNGGHGIIRIGNIKDLDEGHVWIERKGKNLLNVKNDQPISIFFEIDHEGKFRFDIISIGLDKSKRWHQTVEVTRTPDGTCYHNINKIKLLGMTKYYNRDEARND